MTSNGETTEDCETTSDWYYRTTMYLLGLGYMLTDEQRALIDADVQAGRIRLVDASQPRKEES